jgi:hypothetical protein
MLPTLIQLAVNEKEGSPNTSEQDHWNEQG